MNKNQNLGGNEGRKEDMMGRTYKKGKGEMGRFKKGRCEGRNNGWWMNG